MMRFYTVPVAKDARTSANWVIGVVGLYLVMTTVLGFGAAALVGRDTIIAANRAGNSAAPLLALQLGGGPGTLGGEVLVAFISAVTFATILAVVAGLIIAAATNIAHDVYTHVIKAGVSSEKTEVKAAKVATIAVGVAAIALALVTKSLNVAFLVGLAFAVAASANLPVILFSLYWKRFNTTGAVSALIAGVVSAVVLVLVGPAVIGPKGLVLTDVQPLISLINPGIISIPIGFFAGWLGTVLTARELTSEERFTMLQVRALTGFGSEQSAKSH
jgi:cation/acetate symporter